jgi:hypothetical protein
MDGNNTLNNENKKLNSELKVLFIENIPSKNTITIINLSLIFSIIFLIFGLILLFASKNNVFGGIILGLCILIPLFSIKKIPTYIRYFLKNKEVRNKVDKYNKFRTDNRIHTISFDTLRYVWTKQNLLK